MAAALIPWEMEKKRQFVLNMLAKYCVEFKEIQKLPVENKKIH